MGWSSVSIQCWWGFIPRTCKIRFCKKLILSKCLISLFVWNEDMPFFLSWTLLSSIANPLKPSTKFTIHRAQVLRILPPHWGVFYDFFHVALKTKSGRSKGNSKKKKKKKKNNNNEIKRTKERKKSSLSPKVNQTRVFKTSTSSQTQNLAIHY